MDVLAGDDEEDDDWGDNDQNTVFDSMNHFLLFLEGFDWK